MYRPASTMLQGKTIQVWTKAIVNKYDLYSSDSKLLLCYFIISVQRQTDVCGLSPSIVSKTVGCQVWV